jgi:hypothetical protein
MDGKKLIFLAEDQGIPFIPTAKLWGILVHL